MLIKQWLEGQGWMLIASNDWRCKEQYLPEQTSQSGSDHWQDKCKGQSHNIASFMGVKSLMHRMALPQFKMCHPVFPAMLL